MFGKEESKGHILIRLYDLWKMILKKRRALNLHMMEEASANQMSIMVTAICMLVLVIMLFIPSYLGVGNDETIVTVMQNAGLRYLEDDLENGSSYFTRVYEVEKANENNSFHNYVIRAAKWLDWCFTRDNLFDVRFLALIYTMFYAPAVFLLVKAALERVTDFTEKLVVSIATVLIFSDVSYLTYFNSLYVEAILFLGLLYLFAAAMLLQRKSKYSGIYFGLIVISTLLLCLTKNHCFIIGFVVSGFCYLQAHVLEKRIQKIGCYVIAVLLMLCGMLSLKSIDSDYNLTSKFHAMTRGVLLQSSNPVDTLSSFGIEGSYSMLTDVSLYDQYPITTIDNEVLQDGFLNQFSTVDITFFYIRHPNSLISMLDLSMKSAYHLRKDYCGNYERTVGMPAYSKSVLWSTYSTFKVRSAPKTLGFLVLMIVAYSLMAGRQLKLRGNLVRHYYVYLTTMISITFVGVLHIVSVLIHSGDAQLVEFNFIFGFCLDCLFYFVLTEVLHKLNIFEHKGEVNG